MGTGIHSTVIIDSSANIHPSVTIGPGTVIGPRVRIGGGTCIGAHCTIGGPPEHKDYWSSWNYGVRIGCDCFISNGVTIDSGTQFDTIVMDSVTILRNAHVGHDATIENKVTLSCNSIVGGHALVMELANCGLGSIIHQHCIIGPVSMLGMGTIVSKKTPIQPCTIYVGNPARVLKVNQVGMDRSGLDELQLKALRMAYVMAIEEAESK